MKSDYAAIREANRAEYGNVGRWGRELLVNRYDSSSHFIFEVLQNAEDALRRRKGWKGSRAVRFELDDSELRVIHFGNPFTLADVKGVCGVGETTKDLTDIGRFGIGFKSVYSITERPQVHSGDEHFAIENYVFPTEATPIKVDAGATMFVLPLRKDDRELRESIANALANLGPRTLLFLREIEEIHWEVKGGAQGAYLKEEQSPTADGGRRVTVIGEQDAADSTDEQWLVFSRAVSRSDGSTAGSVEVAFQLEEHEEEELIVPVAESPLVAFFPTVLPTHLGFLIQGPYRTTPSRDNVPQRDPWNVHLAVQTAQLLVQALGALKERGLLGVSALQCLPLQRSKYPEGSLFQPLFAAVRDALSTTALLPTAKGEWASAREARLARTAEIRELVDSVQLGELAAVNRELHWLTGEITKDTAGTLREYLRVDLAVEEVAPDWFIFRLSKEFLEAQPDAWIVRLYDFLAGQPYLLKQGRAFSIPFIRLESGAHVVADLDGRPQAFLRSTFRTDFPTVRASVCATPKAMEFLRSLGLTEPDAVDDVIRNVLPRYQAATLTVTDEEYARDIERMVVAYDTQHRGHREKLVNELRETAFVRSVDLGDRCKYVDRPGDVYLATERLTELLDGVEGARLVDSDYKCLHGESVRELLEACGVSRALMQVSVNCELSYFERAELRKAAGCEKSTGDLYIRDHTLRCLSGLIDLLPKLQLEDRRSRARLLWEALKDVEGRRGTGAFDAEYGWSYYQRWNTKFEPSFLRELNRRAWITDADGELQSPEFVTFESLGWDPNPFLASKIRFKPAIIEELAKASGLEPKVLDFLKKRGLTSLEELAAALGVTDEEEAEEDDSVEGEGDGDSRQEAEGEDEVDEADQGQDDEEPSETGDEEGTGTSGGTGTGKGGGAHRGTGGGGPGHGPGGGGSTTGGGGRTGGGGSSTGGGGARTPGSTGGRPFVSYVAADPNDDGPDPDGLNHQERLDLEEAAITFILKDDPKLRRTAAGNKGFDLYEPGPNDHPVRWVEVKAMTGRLADRAVGVSYAQFECAQQHGSSYWLYVVEHAGGERRRLLKIQNPAGLTRTLTFDSGWEAIASSE